jgi:ferric-dicitrate binding protein FerR (iron transport regulator)
MSEHELPTDVADLISKHLSGNASDMEIRQLESWVIAAPENRAHFLAFKKAWLLSGLKKETVPIDVDREWQDIATQLFSSAKVVEMTTPKFGRRQWLGVAASIALLVVASVLLFRPGHTYKDVELLAQHEILEENLSDGSKVVLNRNSSLVFTYDIKEGVRRVDLEGDAFFQVVRDVTQPFVINTQDVQVEVLGTSFYVDSRLTNADIQVFVKSGRVAFRAGTSQVVLNEGEMGVFNKTSKQLLKKEIEDQNYLSWKEDALVFDNTSLEEVVRALNRHFRVNITIESANLKTCKITATYTDKTLDAIISILEQTLDLQSKRVSNQLVLFGTGCD